MSIVQYETKAGEPVETGGFKIVPFARVLRIQIPGLSGGLIWNRPASVAVTTADQETIIPVRDVTFQAQVALLAAGLVGALLIWLAFNKHEA